MRGRRMWFIFAAFTVVILATYGAGQLALALGAGPDIGTVVVIGVFLASLFLIDRGVE